MSDTGSGSSPGDINRPFIPGEPDGSDTGSPLGDETAGAYDSAVEAGEVVPPFVPGREPLHYSPGEHGTPPEVIVDQVAGLASHAVELPSITEFLYEEPEPDALAESGYGPLTGGSEPPGGTDHAAGPPYPSHGTTPAHETRQPTPAYGAASSTPPYGVPTRTPAYGSQQQTPAYGAPGEMPGRLTPVPPLPGFTSVRTTPAAMPAIDPRMTPARGSEPVAPPSQPQDPYAPQPAGPPALEPWATGEWQRYDWRAAAALGAEERARAAQAWSDLDWEGEARSRAMQRNSEIAAALEEIARRVRSGELRVHGHAGMSEEAATAAALAALLSKRT